MNRVVVSGAGGFVGRHVTHAFAARGWQVDAAPGDARSYDAVVNLAANTSIRHSLEAPVDTTVTSIAATLRLLEHARRTGTRRFIHLSTDEIYDGPSLCPEWGMLRPRNPYAAAKLAQEALVVAYAASYDLPVTVVSADILVGPGQPSDKVVPALIRQIRAGEPVPIYLADGRIGERYYTPVRNAADLICWLAQDPGRLERERVHAGGGQWLSNLELAHRLGALLALPVVWHAIEKGGRHGWHRSTYNTAEDAGWVPPVTLTDELLAVIAEYCDVAA